jgi:hypothetical protein
MIFVCTNIFAGAGIGFSCWTMIFECMESFSKFCLCVFSVFSEFSSILYFPEFFKCVYIFLNFHSMFSIFQNMLDFF